MTAVGRVELVKGVSLEPVNQSSEALLLEAPHVVSGHVLEQSVVAPGARCTRRGGLRNLGPPRMMKHHLVQGEGNPTSSDNFDRNVGVSDRFLLSSALGALEMPRPSSIGKLGENT